MRDRVLFYFERRLRARVTMCRYAAHQDLFNPTGISMPFIDLVWLRLAYGIDDKPGVLAVFHKLFHRHFKDHGLILKVLSS
jgi:hypothetical protein